MIKPVRGYVLVEPIEAEEMTAAGVYLPDRVKDLPQKGKVLAMGIGVCECIPKEFRGIFQHKDDCGELKVKDFKVGDTVIFKRFVDNRIKEEGKELLLVPFSDILAIYG